MKKVIKITESQLKRIVENFMLEDEMDYEQVVSDLLNNIDLTQTDVDDYNEINYDYGKCVEYNAKLNVTDENDNDIVIKFGRFCEETEEGKSSGFYSSLEVNGYDVKDKISKQLYNKFEKMIQDYDEQLDGSSDEDRYL